MTKISTGIRDLDSLIDFVNIGDNVVWETEAGTAEDVFTRNFIATSLTEGRDVIYVSFNRSPQSILLQLSSIATSEQLTILDCFSAGKGKNDHAFLKFYDTPHEVPPKVVKVERPADIDYLSNMINETHEGLSEGARYVFDSLTGMQDLWGDEHKTYKFFTYMCPRLYDLGTVAYWILEKEAHSQSFKANLRHITQVVLELYKKKDRLYIKAVKLDRRRDREAFKPHYYEADDDGIIIIPARKEITLDIGTKIREARIRLGLSQKELSDRIDMTPSFMSQVESNQVSPSLSSFLQIAEALGLNPTSLLQKETSHAVAPWLIPKTAVRESALERSESHILYAITSGNGTPAYLAVLHPGKKLDRHFIQHKRNELIYVLKGSLSVKIRDRAQIIQKGDVLHLTDSVPSAWENASEQEAELLIVC